MALNFDNYAQDGNHFIKNLSDQLGHPEETARSGIILGAVIAQLPTELKELWKL